MQSIIKLVSIVVSVLMLSACVEDDYYYSGHTYYTGVPAPTNAGYYSHSDGPAPSPSSGGYYSSSSGSSAGGYRSSPVPASGGSYASAPGSSGYYSGHGQQ